VAFKYLGGSWSTNASHDPIVDEVAVLRAVQGERVSLTLAERAEAIRRCLASGRSLRDTGRLLGCTDRTIQRYIYRLGLR